MRKAMKFLHTLGSIGLLGAMAALLVLHSALPNPEHALADYAQSRHLMDLLARRILLPSLGLTIVAGLLAMAAVPAFHGAGWVWLKLATGVLMFEGSLLGIQGPLEKEAQIAADALAMGVATTQLGQNVQAEVGSLWLLGAVAVLNVGLGVWRPMRRRKALAT
jgi:uncharacterized membrane protein